MSMAREDFAACCCAVQNICLSLHAQGIGTKWTTGPVNFHPQFRQVNPTPRAVNPKSSARNPKPETRNPKPETKWSRCLVNVHEQLRLVYGVWGLGDGVVWREGAANPIYRYIGMWG
jgi:nitroreductase